MKRKPIILISALFFLSLISCGTIEKGVIIKKNYLPSRTIYAGSNVYNQIDERYQIIIEGKKENHKLEKRKIFVTKQEYDSLKVGSIYLINK